MFPRENFQIAASTTIWYLYMLLLTSPSNGDKTIVSPRMWGYPRTGCSESDPASPQPILRTDTMAQLSKIRAEMVRTSGRSEKVEAFLVPSVDAHQSSFLAERDKRIEFLSGFTGSGAMAIITHNKAAIWVDPKDAGQADEEIHCHWSIFTNSKSDVSIPQWVQVNLRARSRIGVDATLLTQTQWDILSKRVTLMPVKNNIVDQVWASTFFRPPYPDYRVTVQPSQYTGKTWEDKVADVRGALKNESCDMIILTALDEISWLLNIRGRETDYLPVVRAYLLITNSVIYLYANGSKFTDYVNKTLKIENCYSSNCVKLLSYENVWGDLKTMSTQIWSKAWIPSEAPLTPGSSRAIFDIVQSDKLHKVSPVALMKATKNEEERKGMANAHLRDAVAFCDYMAYIENKMKSGEDWDEYMAAEMLDEFRRQQPLSEGISFKTVVAFGAHSASPHHDTRNLTSIKMDSSSILLISSGGQYLDGTTDLTRTFHLGNPTEGEIFVYTKVLMGLIDLASAAFPDSTTLQEIDVLARSALWDDGLRYDHPTGHGIGSYLSVEEGPLIISQDDHHKQRFKEGYFISAGPAHYETGQYGIRIENVLEVVPHHKFQNDSNLRLLTFRTASLVPFEPKLIDRRLLSPKQIAWLNEYNTRIREEVGAELKKQTRMKGFYWMMEKTQVIPDSRCSSSSLFNAFQTSILVICFLPFLYGY